QSAPGDGMVVDDHDPHAHASTSQGASGGPAPRIDRGGPPMNEASERIETDVLETPAPGGESPMPDDASPNGHAHAGATGDAAATGESATDGEGATKEGVLEALKAVIDPE